MWIGVIADTHGSLGPEVERVFEEMHLDWILHCGGIGDAAILDRLSAFARVTGVVGESDERDEYPLADHLVRDFGGVPILTHHDAGTPSRPSDSAQQLIEEHDPKVILFGRTGEAFNAAIDGRLWFNPGAANRAHAKEASASVGLLEIDGQSVRGEIVVF